MNEGNPLAVAPPSPGAETLEPSPATSVDPADLAQDYWQTVAKVWTNWTHNWNHWVAKGFGSPHSPPHDRRFAGSEWQTPYFAMLRDIYLATSRYWEEMVTTMRLPPKEQERFEFSVKQMLDAMAPTNFPATNPEALKLALATDGDSLRKGAENFFADMSKGRVSMTDDAAFEVGRNLALTPGSVVYRNDLIELIQYKPSTAKVYERPLLIVPPCINKYYILDMQPDNSLVRYAVTEGFTVFLISWRNIPAEMGTTTWDDYLENGVLQGLSAMKSITRAKLSNVLGFCVGGALLASALAVLAARGDKSVASVTFLTTMLDYEDPGQIGVYVDPITLSAREPALLAGERINGSELAGAFASLRANELIWSFVVNNYLKGRTPAAFDLLYWNGDSANLPGPMYVYYIRNCYLNNLLREPGMLEMCGIKIDLRTVQMPAYILATREDHIVPWRSAYRSVMLLGGDSEFVLGGSGHIAGVVNSPVKNKREYWIDGLQGASPDEWLASAEQKKGSWWPHWRTWLARQSGAKRAAPDNPGSDDYPVLDPAPGRYVREKA